MTLDRRPRHTQQFATRREHDRLFVLDNRTDVVHELNATAAAIWESCDGETTVQELIEAIAELTGRGPEQVAGEVDELVIDLTRRGLLTDT